MLRSGQPLSTVDTAELLARLQASVAQYRRTVEAECRDMRDMVGESMDAVHRSKALLAAPAWAAEFEKSVSADLPYPPAPRARVSGSPGSGP